MLNLYRHLKSGINYKWELKWQSRKLGIPVDEIEKIMQSYDNLLREIRGIGRQVGDLGFVTSDEGTSGVHSFVIVFEKEPISIEAVELLADELWPATRCMHDYDCCGHWYANAPRVEQLGPCTFRITQGVYQNV